MLELVSFLASAAVMILELAGMRIIAPFLGSDFIIWTSTIGIIMASLSIGYWVGGKLADKNISILKLSSLILGAGLYILILAIFQFKFLDIASTSTMLNAYFRSLLATVVMFTVPSICLGIVSPYLIKTAIVKRNIPETNTGKIIGNFYAISTLGSIVGTFLCGFYLILFFGIDTIFFALSSILFVSALIPLVLYKKDYLNNSHYNVLLCFEICILIFSFFLTYDYKVRKEISIIPDTVYSVTTPYAFIAVVDNYWDKQSAISLYNSRFLRHSIRKKYALPNEFPHEHYHQIFYDLYKQKQNKDNILLLGNAAGTYLSAIIYDMNQTGTSSNIDVVEIDKELTNIAHKYFFMPEDKRVTFHYKDARVFLNQTSQKKHGKKYDLIYFDIYTNNYLIPYHLITQETMQRIQSLLNDNGILCINVIGGSQGSSKDYLNQMYTQVKSVFSDVEVYKYPKHKHIFNVVITGFSNSNSQETQNIKNSFRELKFEAIQENSTVFTDNYVPVEKFLEIRLK